MNASEKLSAKPFNNVERETWIKSTIDRNLRSPNLIALTHLLASAQYTHRIDPLYP